MAGAGSKASASSDDTVKRVRRTKPSMLDGQTMIGLIDHWADFRSRYNLHGWRAGNTPEASAPSLDQKRTHACCTVAGPVPNLSPTAETVSACPKRHRDACTRSFGLQGSLQLVDFLTSKSYSVSISQSARSRVTRKKYWKRLLSKLSKLQTIVSNQ